MADLSALSMDALRALSLAGNEMALDEMIRRMDKEIEDAVVRTLYDMFMEERAAMARSCKVGRCSARGTWK